MPPPLVPAKAGIQSLCNMLALTKTKASCEENWVPAFAGMSGVGNSFTRSKYALAAQARQRRGHRANATMSSFASQPQEDARRGSWFIP